LSLIYKPDWEEAKEHYRAWWAHEALDRCAIWVTAPKECVEEGTPPVWPTDPVQRWTDLDFLAELNDFHQARTFFGGEAFPMWTGGYPGHVSMPTFLGGTITLDMNTGWHGPVLTGADWTPEELCIDKENRWYRFGIELARVSVEASRGKSIPTMGAFGGCGDTLSAIRGNERLLFDVVERPELVRETELRLMELFAEFHSTIYDIVSPGCDGGSAGWFPIWAPGRFYAAHCDFSCMISPEMFQELFLPAIERQLDYLDYCIFHVDGVDAFRHVPALCELPKLQALQIGPEAGRPGPLHYMDVLKAVQAHGKNLQITLPPDEVEQALTELSARGLLIMTRCDTEQEARKLLANAGKWSHN